MKSCVALILSVTTVLCSSYGSPVSGGAEFDILAKVHHRVARATSPPTVGPTGTGTTSNPATGSTGSSVISSSPVASYLLLVGIAKCMCAHHKVIKGDNIILYNSVSLA